MERGRDELRSSGSRRAAARALARPVFAAPVAAGLRALPRLPAIAGGWFRGALREEIENRRLLPWLAVAYGAGILLAFAADGPPSFWPALAAGATFAALAWRARARLGRQAALAALAAVFFGFAATLLRMALVEAPVLARPLSAKVSGFVESVEERSGGGGRLVLRVSAIEGLAETARPERVRLTVRSLGTVAPGDFVRATARLMPPPEAARPGGYDFARDAYFRGIGAVGSVSGSARRAIGPPPDFSTRFAAMVDRARNALTARIAGSIGGQAGAVAAALVTGKRGLIEEKTNDILRAAGIYHVVSISGLHMVLAAGVFFTLARGLLALSPGLALFWPIKKIAALVGMAAAAAYCIFSGAEVATERSLVMILVMQGAILCDRPAMSMRNLALSALIVLTREPEALLGPSFQMSYGAVAGLITLAEVVRRRRRASEPGDALRRAGLKLGGIVFGVAATTLVATAATAPFGTYHFQNLQPYGLIGNAATLPLVSFAVMPAAVIGILALPFGLDQPVWAAMGWAVEAVLRLSGWVAGFANSIVIVPAFGGTALGLFAAALLLATLPGSSLRILALLPLVAGLALAAAARRPDIYVARDGTGMAVRQPDGRLLVLGPVAAFTVEQWLRADGDPRRAGDRTLRDPSRCDPLGCAAHLADGRAVSVVANRRGFEEDCRRAAILVSRHKAPPGCAASVVLDRDHLAGHGATTLRIVPSGILMESVRKPGPGRPWMPQPQAGARAPAGLPAQPPGAGGDEPGPEGKVP